MSKILIFPSIQIACCIGASIFYFWSGDIRRGIYWISAAILTASVTF